MTATTSIGNVSTTNGRPAPFVQFTSPLGVTTAAEPAVTAARGATFRFRSVDVFSATTTVGYSITGIGNGAAVFMLQNTIGSQFGTGFTRSATPTPPECRLTHS